MVTAKTQYSLQNAKGYFEEHLCVGDYYDEGQRISGEWFGSGAEGLGLLGKVRAEEFLLLCDNQHPFTGDRLTQRLKTTSSKWNRDRRKSTHLLRLYFLPTKVGVAGCVLSNGERIVEAHARAVRLALKEFEAFAATRVRTKRAESDRLTGSFVATLFTHDTSRALDPHLHTHCIVFTTLWHQVGDGLLTAPFRCVRFRRSAR